MSHMSEWKLQTENSLISWVWCRPGSWMNRYFKTHTCHSCKSLVQKYWLVLSQYCIPDFDTISLLISFDFDTSNHECKTYSSIHWQELTLHERKQGRQTQRYFIADLPWMSGMEWVEKHPGMCGQGHRMRKIAWISSCAQYLTVWWTRHCSPAGWRWLSHCWC